MPYSFRSIISYHDGISVETLRGYSFARKATMDEQSQILSK